MSDERIEALRKLLERNPADARVRFGLAAEYERLGRWRDAARELREYLAAAEDEGNAWGRLARVLRRLGSDDQARDAYRSGIDAATRHGHPSMAAEFEAELEELDET